MTGRASKLKAMYCELSAITAQLYPHNLEVEDKYYTIGWAIERIERLEAALREIATFGGDDAAARGARLVINAAGHLECRIIARSVLHHPEGSGE